mmetsp:Transcript_88774/g.247070  ORF Transcript_88774/g.247070 Transcript_88774/m.247070 type:complete len:207 (-) Transcript_88774:132-752(-)
MAAVFGGPFFAMLGNMRDQVVRSVLGSDGGENQLSVGIFPDPVTGKPRDLPLLPAAVMALCLLAGLLLAAARGRKRWLPARGSVAQRAARAAALAFFVSALSETVKRSSAAMRETDEQLTPHFSPVRGLVVTGPYVYTRNPIYCCVAICYPLGAAIVSDDLNMGLVGLLLAVYLHLVVIPAEERLMQKLFSNEFEALKASVPRWLW